MKFEVLDDADALRKRRPPRALLGGSKLRNHRTSKEDPWLQRKVRNR